MRIWKSVLCAVLCLTVILGTAVFFTSCDNNSNVKVDEGTRAEMIEAEKSKTFQVLRSGVDRSNKENSVVRAMDEFEQTYGRKIDFVTCGYDEWTQKVMASIASGSPIAVVNGSEYEFPLYAMKKYAQPLDGLVNFDSEYVSQPISDLFLYKGKHYVASSKGAGQPLVIYYNKTMFENEGVEDPRELYDKKEWTFDKFKEIAMKFTRDTNGDGQYDQWGLCAWYQWVFFGGSAASVCKINDEGLFELNMDNNPALVEALELIQSGWHTDNWVGLEGSDIYTSFYQQKNAMINEFTWAGTNILRAKEEGQFAFDVGVVSFPFGSNNPDRLSYCFLDGFSILNGCATPYSAGALIDLIMKHNVKSAEEQKAAGLLPEEWSEFYEELASRPFNSSMPDNAIDGGKTLCSAVGGGMNIQQAFETYKPVYEALIKEANIIPTDKVEHDFTTINLDFTGGSMEGILKAGEHESLSVAIEGDCLAAKSNVYAINGDLDLFKLDKTKYPMWGYKAYKVTFEYKVDEIPADISVYKFTMTREGINGSMNTFVPSDDAVGAWQTGEVTISGLADNEALELVVTASYAGNIYFKNIKVEEIEQ